MSAAMKTPYPGRPKIKIVSVDAKTRDTINRNLGIEPEMEISEFSVAHKQEIINIFVHSEKSRKRLKNGKKENLISNIIKLPGLSKKGAINIDLPIQTGKIASSEIEEIIGPLPNSIVVQTMDDVAKITSENLQLEDKLFKGCSREQKKALLSEVKKISRGIENQYLHFIEECMESGMDWDMIQEGLREFGKDFLIKK